MSYVFCDAETTGIDPGKHEIIEMYFVHTDREFNLISDYHLKCNPMIWDNEAEEIHGINKEQASKYPRFKDCYKFLMIWLKSTKSKHLVMHVNNTIFGKYMFYDYAILKTQLFDTCYYQYCEFIRQFRSYDLISTHALAKELKSEICFQSLNLKSVCDVLGIKLDNAHNAKADVEATIEIAKRLIPRVDIQEFLYRSYFGELHEGTKGIEDKPNNGKPRKRKASVRR